MTAQPTGAPSDERRRRRRPALVVGALLLVAVIVFIGFAAVRDPRRQALPSPTFPSPAGAPDAALHGTVA